MATGEDAFFELLQTLPEIKRVAFDEQPLLVEDLSSSDSGSLRSSPGSPGNSPLLLRRRRSANKLRASSSPSQFCTWICTIESDYVIETSGDALCRTRHEARQIAAANFLQRLRRYDNDQRAAANRPEAIAALRAQHSVATDSSARRRGVSSPPPPRRDQRQSQLRLDDSGNPSSLFDRVRLRLRNRASSPRNITISQPRPVPVTSPRSIPVQQNN